MIETIVAPNPGAFTLDGTHTYVVDERMVIDPGPAIASHIDAIAARLSGPPLIFVTHRHADPAPGAGSIHAPRNCIDALTDRFVADSEIFFAGARSLRAIATPGHTNEHFCFLTGEGDLFTGDTVLGAGTTVIFPPDGDMDAYIATLERLIAVEPRRIYPGHGPIRDDAVALLQEYLSHRLMREKQIVDLLASRPLSIAELREEIYPELDVRLLRAAELQLEAHLERLLRRGRVVAAGERYRRGMKNEE
jgi:glyoxylase-like metal-dependent hydrolase (beta-lactamase superfamily II)